MKQLLQNISTGEVSLAEVPAPARGATSLLVATRASVISAGTERQIVELGKASALGKARARPDLARKVIAAAKADGIGRTITNVRGRLAEPNALGYSLAGEVLDACEGAPAAPGDLVACAGVGFASHAELVTVPRNLCARVPEGVPAEDAAYATITSIALHGARLAELQLGDVGVVIGLGLVGQLAVEVLQAAGCVVLGLDPDAERAKKAEDSGVFATTDPSELKRECNRRSGGRGADGVLVTAASESNAPLVAAVDVARERAVISIVGDVPVEAPRSALFAKELRLVVSRSYGPGRYDPSYEVAGIDYPSGYVRWTEGRNLHEALRLMSTGQLRPSRLTTHSFDIDDGPRAYALLSSGEPSLGITLTYPGPADASRTMSSSDAPPRTRRSSSGRLRVGVIGAGMFGRTVLLPELAQHSDIVAVATATGASATATAKRYGAELATTDPDSVLGADGIDAVVIATRHDSHAEYATRALEAGQHVFVEKPLAIDYAELDRLEGAAHASPGLLMVGFNRRFAPFTARVRDALGGRGPLVITYRVNAGRVAEGHWTVDPAVGGGRIVGEVCHFVDFAVAVTGAGISGIHAVSLGPASVEEVMTATLSLSDGSVTQIVYSGLQTDGLEKERVEILGEAGAASINDFRELTLYRDSKRKTKRAKRDKGHSAEIRAFVDCCADGRQPWPLADMFGVMRATFEVRDALRGPTEGSR